MKRNNFRKGAEAALGGILMGLIMITPAYAATISSDLSVGSRGAGVTALQQFLAQDTALYPQGLVTGFFGNLTRAAVIRFQERVGISPIGRVGPLTRASINGMLALGLGPQSIGGAEVDVWAPLISGETVATSTNAITISWTTNEPARHRVMYGTTYPFLYSTAPAVVSAGVDERATLTIPNLSADTQYFYVLESTDLQDNVMLTSPRVVRTGR